jgi:hypothetical protein
MIGLALARKTNLVDASNPTNKTVEQDERRRLSHLGADNGTEPGSDKP